MVAVKSEARSATVTIIASSLNIMPTTPGIKSIGRKTTTVVKVEAPIAKNISCVPEIEASCGCSPLSKCRETLSTTTIALSTTMPIAIVREERLIVFMVLPLKNR